MNIDTIYQTIQSQPHGSSGRGTSYWEDVSRCGRAATLKVLNPRPETGPDDEDLNALRVGSFYHALHEASLAGQRDGQVWDMSDTAIADIDWMEALRLYRAYTSHWATATRKWHALIEQVEVKLPRLASTIALVRSLFGDDVTFRADWVGSIDTTADLEAVRDETGLYLPEPGRYIFDHKTSKSRKSIHQWQFAYGNQATIYLHLYNLEHPEAPAKGMIFDQILKHQDISKGPLLTKTGTVKRESSYQHFLALPNEEAEQIIRALVQRGRYNLEEGGRCNPEHCFSNYEPCWFFANGLCKRF